MAVAAVTVKVKNAGSPLVGAVVGAVTVMVGAAERFTVTVPDAWPELLVVLVVPVPVPVPVVVVTCAPTLAVTIACVLVVNTDAAAPLVSVSTKPEDNVPAVVTKATGVATNALPLTSITMAVTVVDPPTAGTEAGLAFTRSEERRVGKECRL